MIPNLILYVVNITNWKEVYINKIYNKKMWKETVVVFVNGGGLVVELELTSQDIV